MLTKRELTMKLIDKLGSCKKCMKLSTLGLLISLVLALLPDFLLRILIFFSLAFFTILTSLHMIFFTLKTAKIIKTYQKNIQTQQDIIEKVFEKLKEKCKECE